MTIFVDETTQWQTIDHGGLRVVPCSVINWSSARRFFSPSAIINSSAVDRFKFTLHHYGERRLGGGRRRGKSSQGADDAGLMSVGGRRGRPLHMARHPSKTRPSIIHQSQSAGFSLSLSLRFSLRCLLCTSLFGVCIGRVSLVSPLRLTATGAAKSFILERARIGDRIQIR